MLNEVLKGLKNSACLRLDVKQEMADFKERTYKFRQEFPEVFSLADPSSIGICKGWEGIVRVMCMNLRELGIRVTGIKQKFGELRVSIENQYGGARDEPEQIEAKRIIGIAEALSKGTCEFCSQVNQVSIWERGYVARVCVDCKRIKAEYNLLYDLLEDEREPNELRQKMLDYDKEVLRRIYAGEDITYRGSFYDMHLASLVAHNIKPV